MSLQTACPICHTVFKVDDSHLASAQGMVQCGVCGMVFNARQHLKLEQSQPPVVAIDASPAAAPVIPTTLETINADTYAAIDSTPELSGPEFSITAHSPTLDAVIAEDVFLPLVDAPTQPEPSDIVNIANDTPAIQFKKQTSPKLKTTYAILVIALASGLVLQLSLQYKDQLTARFPALLPIYSSFCEGTLCTMATPYDASQIALTNSSFEIDPKHKDRIIVTLDITNNAEMTLQYPRIALTLLDNEDRIISVKNLSSQDYLLAKNRQNELMPHDDTNIKLLITVDAERVVGYKIKLF